MRHSTILLSVFLIGLMLTSVSVGQDIGDYGSITDGNWGALTTWAKWDGSGFNEAATSVPSTSVNVYVRSGHTVTVESSGKNCKNLIIQEGGTLISNTVMPTSSIVYVRVAGSSVLNNGTIGTLDNLNTISFEAYKNLTFQGTGISRICRIRPRGDSTNLAITFDTDATLTYTGSSGTGGVGIYASNNANNDSVTIAINSGKTVTCVNYCYVAVGSSGTSDGTATTFFNIDGSLILTGPNTNFNLRSSKSSTLTVNGSLVVGKNFNTVSSGGVVPTIIVNGELTVTEGNVDLSAPASVITGSGTVNIGANANLMIGSAEGITATGSTGAIQTTTRTFSTEARYAYMGTAAQTTGNALPLTVDELTINNPEGVTLENNIEISSALHLTAGVLNAGAYTVKLDDGTDVNRTAGHVNGTLGKTITGGGTPELFDIGDADNYTPVTVTFGNITTSGVLTASVTAGDHPEISNSDLNANKSVNRYYNLTNNGIVFDNYSAVFNFAASDVDAGADTAAFLVQRFSSGNWFTPVTANPLATSIEVTGEVLFGDFVIAEEKQFSMITDYFRSKSNGNWNDPATWESSTDNISWMDATLTPYDTAKTITVAAGDTVYVTESVSVDEVLVEENAVLVLEGSPVVFTLRDGAEDVDMTVAGKVLVTGTANASPGPYSFNATGTVNFESTSFYEHNQNAGSLPVSVWKEGSTIEFTGVTSTAPGNRNQNFSNIIWNCPEQSTNLNMGFSDVEISGNINVINTGSSRWQLCGPSTGNSAYLSILGDINQSGGNFTSQGTGNGNTTIVIHTYGDITTTAGNFSVARGSQSGTGTTTWYLHGNLSMTNTETQNSNAAGAKFVFSGAGIHDLTLDNVTFTGGFPVQVDSTVLNLGVSEIKGSGIFTLTPTSVLITANEGGLDSALQNTGVITLDSEADYVFNGSAAQITGVKLPASVKNLGINNNTGVTLSSDVQINDKVEILAGNLLLDGKTITLGSAATLVETNGIVTGTSGKVTTTRGINAPAAMHIAGMGIMLTSAADLGTTTVERIHSPATGNSNAGISRIFHVLPANNNSLDATIRFYYAESELNTIPEADLEIFSSSDGADGNWEMRNGTINTTENYAEVSGLNHLSYWTLGDQNHPVPVEMISLNASSDQYNVVISWSTATENQNRGWDIERRPASDPTWNKVGFIQGKGNSTEISLYQFKDSEALSGKYQYRLKQLDFNGTFSYSDIVEVEASTLPAEFAMYQNYPNPFNPETIIRFDLPEESLVNLSVYNSIGEKVLTLVNEKMEKGRHSRTFKAANLSSGIYIYRLTAGNNVFTKKMMLVK